MLAKSLIDAGADVSIKSGEDGKCAFGVALETQNEELQKMLIDSGKVANADELVDEYNRDAAINRELQNTLSKTLSS